MCGRGPRPSRCDICDIYHILSIVYLTITIVFLLLSYRRLTWISMVCLESGSKILMSARFEAPSATVHPFGSTVNGFGEETSDLDVLVAIKEEDRSSFLAQNQAI